MPIADTKKCQTLINTIGEQAKVIKAASIVMADMKARFLEVNPDTTGTPLDGQLATIAAWLASVATVANDPVAAAFISHIVPTHRNHALDEEA